MHSAANFSGTAALIFFNVRASSWERGARILDQQKMLARLECNQLMRCALAQKCVAAEVQHPKMNAVRNLCFSGLGLFFF
jgi:hypothetical protein